MSLRKIIFGCVLIVATGIAFGKTQLQQDRDTFKDLFISLADMGGAELLTCGMKTERDQLIKSAIFIMEGFNTLNKKFPLADPPIDVQIRERNQDAYYIINHGNPDNTAYCETVKKYNAPRLIGRFETAEGKVKERLKNTGNKSNGASRNEIGSTAQLNTSCSARSKYYQDEFQRTGNTDSLICAKKALERELQ